MASVPGVERKGATVPYTSFAYVSSLKPKPTTRPKQTKKPAR